MQVGEQDLALAQHLALACLGFLDLDDHVGCVEHLFGGADDLGARNDVVFIGKARSSPRLCFHRDLMSVGNRLGGGIWCQTDAKFLWFDFFGAPDVHFMSSLNWRDYVRGGLQLACEWG